MVKPGYKKVRRIMKNEGIDPKTPLPVLLKTGAKLHKYKGAWVILGYAWDLHDEAAYK
jgi:hypothetical protein